MCAMECVGRATRARNHTRKHTNRLNPKRPARRKNRSAQRCVAELRALSPVELHAGSEVAHPVRLRPGCTRSSAGRAFQGSGGEVRLDRGRFKQLTQWSME